MGAARGTYTPDVVMLFSQLQPKAIEKIWNAKNIPEISPDEEHNDISDKNKKSGSAIKSFLEHHGMAICKLKVPKCRDGMTRFTTLLMFHFHKNTFTYINWGEIKKIAKKYRYKFDKKLDYSEHHNKGVDYEEFKFQ
jgi:hypothetical protein